MKVKRALVGLVLRIESHPAHQQKMRPLGLYFCLFDRLYNDRTHEVDLNRAKRDLICSMCFSLILSFGLDNGTISAVMRFMFFSVVLEIGRSS